MALRGVPAATSTLATAVASAALAAVLAGAGCGASMVRQGTAGCEAGQETPCACAPGVAGLRSCDDQGSLGACQCGPPDAAAAPDLARPSCGNGACETGEECAGCPSDCGACPACDFAPSCSGAVAVPSSTSLRADLCVGDHAGGDRPDAGDPAEAARTCGPPRLRLRLKQVHWTNGADNTYCIVQASDGTASAVAITPRTGRGSDGRDFFWDPAEGIFWGTPMAGLQTSSSNLTITYNCFVVKGDAWSQVLKAAGDAANKAGGVAGLYGWAFGLGAVAADVAAAALQAASADEHRFNAQQTIDRAELLDLTNGRSWTVQRSGTCSLLCRWNWTLTVEAWGCADARTPPG